MTTVPQRNAIEPELRALLIAVHLHLNATTALFEVLPAERRTRHMAQRARELVGRIEGVLQTADTDPKAQLNG